jgi:chromosome segregation ATPase
LRNITSFWRQIDEAAENLGKEYEEALKEIESIKGKINGLEQVISQKAISTGEVVGELRSAEERLDELTDRLITRSTRAWERYRALEQDCSEEEATYKGLEDLRSLCKKTEELASDLLCYALARFRRTK